MEIGDIENAVLKGEFIQVTDPNFTFGRSRSTLRYFVQTFKMCGFTYKNGYDVHYSGWANSLIRDDEGLTYPVFRLDSDASGEQPIYMQHGNDGIGFDPDSDTWAGGYIISASITRGNGCAVNAVKP